LLDKEFGFKFHERYFIKTAHVLNVLISVKLTKGCFNLITTGNEKTNIMNMLFNPKRMSDNEIVCKILKALIIKFRMWNASLKKSSEKNCIAEVKSINGFVQIDKKFHPYGPFLDKMKNLKHADEVLTTYYYRYGGDKF